MLAPLLFNLLTNDIVQNLRQCEMTLYADESVLYVADKTCNVIEEKLNGDLQLIANWFSQNNLVINLKKPKPNVSFTTQTRKHLKVYLWM